MASKRKLDSLDSHACRPVGPMTRSAAAAARESSGGHLPPLQPMAYIDKLMNSLGTTEEYIYNTSNPAQISRCREWSLEQKSDSQGTHTMSDSDEQCLNPYPNKQSTTMLGTPEQFQEEYDTHGFALFRVNLTREQRDTQIQGLFESLYVHRDRFVIITNGMDSGTNDDARRQANLGMGPSDMYDESMETILLLREVLRKLLPAFAHLELSSLMALMTLGEARLQGRHLDDDASKLFDIPPSEIPGQIFFFVLGGTLIVHDRSHVANRAGGYTGSPIPASRLHCAPFTCAVLKRDMWHGGDGNCHLDPVYILYGQQLVNEAYRVVNPPPLFGTCSELSTNLNVTLSIRLFMWVDHTEKGRRASDEATQRVEDVPCALTMLQLGTIWDTYPPVYELRQERGQSVCCLACGTSVQDTSKSSAIYWQEEDEKSQKQTYGCIRWRPAKAKPKAQAERPKAQAERPKAQPQPKPTVTHETWAAALAKARELMLGDDVTQSKVVEIFAVVFPGLTIDWNHVIGVALSRHKYKQQKTTDDLMALEGRFCNHGAMWVVDLISRVQGLPIGAFARLTSGSQLEDNDQAVVFYGETLALIRKTDGLYWEVDADSVTLTEKSDVTCLLRLSPAAAVAAHAREHAGGQAGISSSSSSSSSQQQEGRRNGCSSSSSSSSSQQ